MTNDTLLLSYADVQKCISMKEVTEIVEDVFRQHGLGRVAMPAKITLDMTPFGHKSHMNAMPAFIQKLDVAGIKWIGGFGANPPRGLPYVMGMLILTEPDSGKPLAVMEASWITAMRTGASAAVAARYLAPEESKIAAIIGAGVQGRSCLSALDTAMKLDEVRIADISIDALTRSIDEMTGKVSVKLKKANSTQEAVMGADVIVTATTADQPVVMDSWVRPEALLVSLGSYPELEEYLVLSASKIVVDSWAQNKHRGELVRLYARGEIKDDSIYAELGSIVAGKMAGREKRDGRIVSCLIGIGAEDVGVAKRIYDRARDSGLGQKFTFTHAL
jgi:ornithine cyclodeaminase/alanine dehydrogenase-like protein (mu-crystallin family)